MRVSGVIRFDALTKADVQMLEEFERRSIKGVYFTFGPLPGRALMFWDSTAPLSAVSDLIELLSTRGKFAE
jgi:hypothetical protein